jgi:predicted small metal-binding protein
MKTCERVERAQNCRSVALSNTIDVRESLAGEGRFVNSVEQGERGMGKVIECAQVVPESGCDHVVRGATEEEALQNAAEHAKEHGIVEITPDLMEKVKAAMHDE